MCKRLVYVFLVVGFCVGVAQADLTMVPLSTWEITGDFGDVLSLNGYAVDRLIVGKSVFANPPGDVRERTCGSGRRLQSQDGGLRRQ